MGFRSSEFEASDSVLGLRVWGLDRIFGSRLLGVLLLGKGFIEEFKRLGFRVLGVRDFCRWATLGCWRFAGFGSLWIWSLSLQPETLGLYRSMKTKALSPEPYILNLNPNETGVLTLKPRF